MVLKLLLVIGVIGAVYFFFIKKSMPLTKERKENKAKNDDETMVECATCSTFVSVNEAIKVSENYYCSTECRNKN